MPAELILVTGGTRSGKSAFAERLLGSAASVTYVAPGPAAGGVQAQMDAEMAGRIGAHQRRRPARWVTVETADVGHAIAQADGPVLVDSVGAWVQARMDAEQLWERGDLDGICADAERWLEHASGLVVVVAEQVGGGVVPTGRGSRRWIDTVGAVTEQLSRQADRAVLVVAGRALELSPAHGTDPRPAPAEADLGMLSRHGDAMVPPDALDLAVNVLPGRPAAHVRRALAEAASGRYPAQGEAAEAVAEHTGLSPDHVVLLGGAAEAFWLIPHALRPTRAAVVHPTFTAPEAALRACDVPIVRVPRDAAAGWRLRPDRVPEDVDLVSLGNPNNPTGTLDEPSDIASLCRPGRHVVVDEAFMDFVLDNRSSLAGMVDHASVAGSLIVLRSITKMWSVPGVRAGYLLAAPALAARLRAHQQPWPVSAAGLAAIVAALGDEAWRIETATGVARRRDAMVRRLGRLDGVTVHDGAANFVLLEVETGPAIHRALLARGIAVRPSTFPLLPTRFLRVAVHDAEAIERLATTLEELL